MLVRYWFACADVLTACAGSAHADEGAGWYTRDQAAAGGLQYVPKCGVCHGADLKGAGAPELKGPGFAAKVRLLGTHGCVSSNARTSSVEGMAAKAP